MAPLGTSDLSGDERISRQGWQRNAVETAVDTKETGEMIMGTDVLVFNGIDGDTGAYDLPPMTAEDLVRVIRGEVTPENLKELRSRTKRATTGYLGVKEGVDPKDLAAAGWGVIFPNYRSSDSEQAEKEKRVEAIREALQPLLQLREEQTQARFNEWVYGADKGYRVGADTKNAYLARHGAGPGPADPDIVPYYLLIVGGPGDIPYRFQSQLDVQYAVGRIHFDTLQEYADYAASVVAAERSPGRLARQAAFFGVANPDDLATQLSSSRLIEPLSKEVRENHPDWEIHTFVPEQATKATLTALLGGPLTPSLLFTAGHGMKFAKDSDRQLLHQGALLCQEWPGPQQWTHAIPHDFYFAGDDLNANADLLGLIAFFFACYGGGTPQYSEFARRDHLGATKPTLQEIATQPFLARLPLSMLGRPRGALAVVGHVERAWSYSFDWGKSGSQTTVFESTIKRLLDGHPIGSAIEYFNERYAELSTMLSDELEEIDFGKQYDPFELAGMWTANNDARGYAIIGDPAVRLPVARDDEEPVERAVIEVQPVTIETTLRDGVRPWPAAGDVTPEAELVMLANSASIGFGVASRSATEVRTYISEHQENPPPADLRIVTRQRHDGVIETIVHPDVADNGGLLALHARMQHTDSP